MDENEYWRNYRTTWRDWRDGFLLVIAAALMVSIPMWVFP